MAPRGELRFGTRSHAEHDLPGPSRDLVTILFSGAPEFARKPAVLATGILVALCEWPVMDALRQFLGEDEDSLGIGVWLCDQAPVRVGTTLTITACCASVTGRVSRWNVRADDHKQTIARGWTECAVVRTAVFRRQEALPLIAHGDQHGDTVAGRPERSVPFAAQLTPLRVPLTDPPKDRLAEITNLVDPREQGRGRPF
jgi:fluoroacetyl-CoA thioesterase